MDGFRERLVRRLALADGIRPWSPFALRWHDAREAAVLLPLVVRGNGLQVLLTRRSEALRDHAGQISLPGGRLEPVDDSPEAAALREAQEEVGLSPARVELLGRMAPFQTGTGFIVHTCVGLVSDPEEWRPNPVEVAEIFEVPLSFFLDPNNHRRHVLKRGKKQYQVHAMEYGDYYIWGATAGILRQLYVLLRD